MASSFYLTLPSNSSEKHYANNTAGHYFTKLPQTIDLHQEGIDASKNEYEVGLSEITFTNSFCNVKAKTYMLAFRYGNRQQMIVEVPAGLYFSPEEIIQVLQKGLQDAMRVSQKMNAVVLSYNTATRKSKLEILDETVKIVFSIELAKFMRIPLVEVHPTAIKVEHWHGPLKKGVYESEQIIRMDREFEAVYVYTDLIEHRVVGDIVAPLLRMIPISKTDGDMVHYIFTKPYYVPLLRTRFDSVEILLTTDTGQTVVFEDGKTVVTLHIRRRGS